MSSIDTLISLPKDRVITFSNHADLEKYIELSSIEGGHSRGTVLDLYQNFVYSLDGRRACLCASTWTMNHAEEGSKELNVRKREVDGVLVGEALRHISANEELRNNYRDFNMPQFYLDYCAEQGIVDVRSLVMNAIAGADLG